jgi:hypothetical protein
MENSRLQQANTAVALQKLSTRHILVAKLMGLGWKNNAIAETTGFSPGYVSDLKYNPLIQRRMEYYRNLYIDGNADTRREMEALTAEAIGVIGEALHDEELAPKDKYKIALEIMDRGGAGKSVKHDVKVTHLTAGEIDSLTKNAQRAGMQFVKDEIEEAKVVGEK